MKSSIILLFSALFIIPVSATTYQVGPQKQYAAIGSVPWESLGAGDSVLIYAKNEAYKEKWVICGLGSRDYPIVVHGVADSAGNLPVIDGAGATTRTNLNYWNENRGVIKIGGANNPPDTMPSNIIIENLDIKGARPPNTYTGRSGSPTAYINNAAAIHVEKGRNITVRNCILHDCGNGFFCGPQTYNILVEACYIYDNGNTGSIYEHNNYTECHGIIFQYNRFGPLRTGCLGNNLKDRSSGCVIRYNWIESGNRQLDLVDAEDDQTIYNSIYYRTTFVYGNVLIEPEGAGNSQICHYGGDSGNDSMYRKGTLYFYNNTIVSTRTGHTTLFRLSTNDEACDARNNIIYTTASGGNLSIVDDAGTINLYNNWISSGWVKSFSNPSAQVSDVSGNITGTAPGFTNAAAQDFTLVATSPCRDAGTTLHGAVLPDSNVIRMYIKHLMSIARPKDFALDIGANEYGAISVLPRNKQKPGFLNVFSMKRRSSSIIFSLTGPAYADRSAVLMVHSLSGKRIAALKSLPQAGGTFNFVWEKPAAGAYVAVLKAEGKTVSMPCVVQ